MNKLILISLIFLFSCNKMESYEAMNYINEISTDSLIQESKRNLNKLLSKAKHEHSYADSVTTCLDSIQHELELREGELNQAHQQQRLMVVETRTVEAYDIHELKVDKMMYYESDSYSDEDWDGDGVYDAVAHDTIYIDSSATLKEKIIEISLMTEKQKKKLRKQRKKDSRKLPKFK